MSYGRSPYYIIGSAQGISIMSPKGSIERGQFPYPDTGDLPPIPYEAMAQFIAHVAARGTGELQRWIDMGAALDIDYTGFYKSNGFKDIKRESKWLRTRVTVKRKGKKV